MWSGRRWLICLLLPLLFLTAPLMAAEGGAPPAYAAGEILIKYREGADVEPLHAATKARAIGRPMARRWQRLTLPSEMTVEEAIEHYRRQPEVEYAEPNYLARKAKLSNDPYLLDGTQWPLENIDAERAWDETTGDPAVVVAILDTGIYYPHPDLAANLWRNPDETANGKDDDGNGIVDDIYGASFKDGGTRSGDPLDDDTADWHGSHVAGIVGAVGDNDTGIAGVNWQSGLMAVKVLHGPNGDGRTSDIVDGIDYAIDKGARLLNMSLEIGGYSTALAEALERADAEGVLAVSAAANRGTNNDTSPWSPAAIRTPNNIAVAALTTENRLADYSNYGRLSVELGAPGGRRCTLTNTATGECIDPGTVFSTAGSESGAAEESYIRLAGTSQAAPHVTGVAALVMARHPELTHHQVKARLLANVQPLPELDGITISGGMLNAYGAVREQEEPASVFRVVPSSACLGEALVITGSNFGAATGEIHVDGVADPLQPPIAWRPGEGPGGTDEVQWRMERALPLDQYRRLHINDPDAGSGFFVRRTNCKPAVTLAVEPTQGVAPLTVELRAEASDNDGDVVKYEWDLGGGDYTEEGVDDTLHHTFTAGGSYNLRVRVTDDYGSTVAAAPVTVEVAESSGDSRCFIATAAWGTPMEREVRLLRRFRDRYLLDSTMGRAFVHAYYTLSPPLAEAIRERPWARAAVRALLTPPVAVANWLVGDAQASSAPPTPLENEPEAAPGEYLVGFVTGTQEREARAAVERAGGVLRYYRAEAHYGLALFDTAASREEVIRALESQPEIRYTEPNYRARKP